MRLDSLRFVVPAQMQYEGGLALDEIPNDHARDAPLVPSNSE